MRFPLATRYADYDTKGHVNNALFLTYFEMARHLLWVERFGGDPDFPFILAEATVRFVSQARIGDPLAVEITPGEIRNRSWVWNYRVLDARDERVVAEGSTVQVMYDYAERRAIPIPEAMRALLAAP
jgi:acyl-CoA thioester hydrolase